MGDTVRLSGAHGAPAPPGLWASPRWEALVAAHVFPQGDEVVGLLKACESLDDVLTVHRTRRQDLSEAAVAAAVVRFGQLASAPRYEHLSTLKKPRGDPRWAELLGRVHPKRTWSSEALAAVACTVARLRIDAPTLMGRIATEGLRRLLLLTEKEPKNQHHRHLTAMTAVAWAFASVEHRAPPFFEALRRAAVARVDAFEPTDLATLVWASARLGDSASSSKKKRDDFDARDLLVAVADRTATSESSSSSSKDFFFQKPEDVAVVAWAFAEAGVQAPGLFKALVRRACESSLADFTPKDVAHLLWAVARDGSTPGGSSDFYAKVWQRCFANGGQLLEDWDRHDLASAAWALAVAGVKAPALYDRLAEALAPTAAELRPNELAAVAWAYAWAYEHCGAKRTLLLDTVAAAAAKPKKIVEFTPWGLANAACAFATARIKKIYIPGDDDKDDDAPYVAIERQALKTLHRFNRDDLTKLAWAFAEARVAAPALFQAIADAALPKVATFDPAQYADLATAFARAEINRPDLFETMAKHALGNKVVPKFSNRDLAAVALAFSQVKADAPQLYAAIADEAMPRFPDFAPADLAAIAEAYFDADFNPPVFFFSEVAKVKFFLGR